MERLDELKNILVEKGLITSKEEKIAGHLDPDSWIFDCRRALSHGQCLKLVAEALRGMVPNHCPVRVGTLESSGIVLATALVDHIYNTTLSDIGLFFIRKSRKKSGLMRYIEGNINQEAELVLVDDIINSGDSLWKAVMVLEQHGYKPRKIVTILRYRDHSAYQRFADKGIQLDSLLCLNDLTSLAERRKGVKVENLETQVAGSQALFDIAWQLRLPGANHSYITQKSRPAMDHKLLFFGGDDHTFYAVNKDDGQLIWRFQVGKGNDKPIFSDPAIYKDLVIFGAYDGNVYALKRDDGQLVWKYSAADWVGSSPTVAADAKTIFIGLEFGLFRKHGGMAALNADTGRLRWSAPHSFYTHATPLYIKEHDMVAIGCNDGVVRSYDANSGKLLWHFSTYGSSRFNPKLVSGFGEGDIKAGLAYDPTRDILAFGSIDGHLYVLDRETGEYRFDLPCESGIFSTPLIHDGQIYFTSTDKKIRCVNLEGYKTEYEFELDGTRLFSDPVLVNNTILVGTNGGRLYACEPKQGRMLGFFQTTERLTVAPLFDPVRNKLFLRTNANEVLCLELKSTLSK